MRFTKISDYVADVKQVIDQMDKKPILVGHSMGGLITQKYLEKYEAPLGILLASVPPSGVIKTTLKVAFRFPLAFLKANLIWKLGPIMDSPKRAKWLLYTDEIGEEKFEKYFALTQDESYFAYWGMMLTSLPKPKKVKTPMLVMGAEKDRLFTIKQIKATAKAYNTEAILFPNLAHMMMLEDGWQDVADSMIQWISEKDSL